MNLLKSVSLGGALAVSYGVAVYALAWSLGLSTLWAIVFVLGGYVALALVGPLLVWLYAAAAYERLQDSEAEQVYGDVTNFEGEAR